MEALSLLVFYTWTRQREIDLDFDSNVPIQKTITNSQVLRSAP